MVSANVGHMLISHTGDRLGHVLICYEINGCETAVKSDTLLY